MGSFCDDLKQTKKSLEISKSLFNKAIAEEKEKISKCNENDYIAIYKIKAQNEEFIKSVSKVITDLYAKLKKDYKEKSFYSSFALYNIGPAIAKLITAVEKEEYTYQTIEYHYQVEGRNTGYNGTCFIVSKKDFSSEKNELVETEKFGNFLRGKESLCLATSGFDLYPLIIDNKMYRIPRTDKAVSEVKFYNDKDEPTVCFNYFSYIYNFIDMAIDKKVSDPKHFLTMEDFDCIIDDFLVKYQIEDQMKLKKEKN